MEKKVNIKKYFNITKPSSFSLVWFGSNLLKALMVFILAFILLNYASSIAGAVVAKIGAILKSL